MGRLCERPGCSAVAAMAYGFDADRLLVWLAPHDPTDDPLRAGVLCARHAEAMIVPRGWTLDDRREDRPRLFRAEPPATTARKRRRRPPPESKTEQLTLDTAEPSGALAGDELTVADVTGAADEVDGVDEPTATPWRPVFDQADDLDGLLAARSPLLARAFQGTDRPR